jgi:polygalacturonase
MKLKLMLPFCSAVVFTLFMQGLSGQNILKQGTSPDVYNITSFGAKADGKTLNTTAIQKAIDTCSENGGGTVLVPAGSFITGSISLKSHVSLHLSKNAILVASINISDYSKDKDNQSVILVDKAEDVSITGEGTINGRGDSFTVADAAPDRPYVLFVLNSKNIRIENISLKNSAKWTLRLRGNEHVIVKGISIYSHSNFNNDGIDIDSKDVVISDCIIDCDDDALCLKTDSKKMCENIVVTNCILASNCNFIKFGTASQGGFRNIAISNCILRHASESKHRNWYKSMDGVTDTVTGIAGIALEAVDGGFIDHVTINNISMDGIQSPIFIRLGSRKNPTGFIKNVIISNIVATTHSKIPLIICGVPGFNVENVVLRDMIIQFKGGGKIEEANRTVPENEKAYPENRMFGNSLPAYGMYIRHASNITIDNVQLELLQADFRPAVRFDDVQDIEIRGFKATPPKGNMELIIKNPSDKISIIK